MTEHAHSAARLSTVRAAYVPLAMMVLGLGVFFWGGVAPLALLGLAIFGAAALWRPDLGILFVPLTVPLYLIPARIQGVRSGTFLLPIHEAALLAVLFATAAGWLRRRFDRSGRSAAVAPQRLRLTELAGAYGPHALFLLSGLLGVLIAVERGRALREFRWLIAEPLVFYGLVKLHLDQRPTTNDEKLPTGSGLERWSLVVGPSSAFARNLLIAFAVSGGLVGLLGLLQYAGVDLVPLLGQKQCFAPDGGPCRNIVEDGGVRRVLSVYGHPNNLGLYLGRVWPVAAAIGLFNVGAYARSSLAERRPKLGWLWMLCALLCLGGIVVSFSRGAWLGALAAAAVLGLGLTADRRPTTDDRRPTMGTPRLVVGRRWSVVTWLIGGGAALVVLAGLALSIRGDVTAGSTPVRLLLWREALGYIARHPLGIGLDQFGFYHEPGSGLSLIDPALIGTSEQYAAHPHNLLLDIWLRLGPLGMIAFGWLLARFVRAGLRQVPAPVALGALAAMLAALAHGMVDNFYFVADLAMAFWLLMALL